MKIVLRRRSPLHLELLEARCLPSTVTNLSDHDPGSLRDAIATTPNGGTVDFQPGLSGTIKLTTGTLVIRTNLTLAGPGANLITVSGNKMFQVFSIAGIVAISGVTIADGMATPPATGGGLFNEGKLTITSCTFSDNAVGMKDFFGGGGAIFNIGTLTIIGSTFTRNSHFYAGGAIANVPGPSGSAAIGSLTIIGCTFNLNSAERGAGIDNDAGTVTITGSAFSGNSADIFGAGGIYNEQGGRLTITGSTFTGNSGGGIVNNDGTVAITASSFSNNPGGGIFTGGTLAVINSTFSGNAAAAIAGGIDNIYGTSTVTESTFSGNSGAGDRGGAIGNYLGNLTITDSTITGNSASAGGGNSASAGGGNSASAGGGLHSSGGKTTIRNTLFAGNRALSGPDVSGVVHSLGHNLLGDGSGGSGYADTDLVGTSVNPIDPQLGPLQDNGGPTKTVALLSGSPAIAAGGPSDREWDQRGPGFARIVNGRMDIGAYEVQDGGSAGDVAQPPNLWQTTFFVREAPVGQIFTSTIVPASALISIEPLTQTVPVVDRFFASRTSKVASFMVSRSKHAPAEIDLWARSLLSEDWASKGA